MPEPDRSVDRFFDRLVNDPALSRRDVLRAFGALGVTAAGGSLLSACGGVEGTNQGAGTATDAVAAVRHPPTEIGRLNFANWPLYIDKDVIRDFEREHDGADVNYIEEINANDEFYGKVRAQLERGQDIRRDLVVLTDWMAATWIRNGFTEPIDRQNVPNAENLTETLREPPFDPERLHTLPWQSGMTGIGYDPRRTGGELSSVGDLFDPRFKGRVTFLSEARDSTALVLLGEGKDPGEASIDDILAAIDKIEKANADGQIRRFTGNDYTNDLARGNVWLAVAYSGDIIQLQEDNPELRFLIPEEGAVLWSDNMMMPKSVRAPYTAETFMNYVYEPEVAAKIAAYVNYVTPVDGAQEVAERDDPELAANELVFPSAETMGRLKPYASLSPEDERRMNERFQQVMGG
jgi:spermidine/putrescine transport system substrate-binding protein